MNKTASACDGLNQLASASATDDEASGQLMQALASADPFPINLAWIVPLLNYKHISSLTTHLKRHFEKDEHFQKYSSGGARTHTYRISIFCFREICQFARHSQRRTLAQYWVKVIDEVSGANFKDSGKRKYKKLKITKHRSPPSHDENEEEDEEDVPVDDDDDEEADIVAFFQQNGHHSTSSNDAESDGDIEAKSTTLLSSLCATAAHYTPLITSNDPPSPQSANSLYNYSITSTPPKRAKKDFTNVSILNRKRKNFEDASWAQKSDSLSGDDTPLAIGKDSFSNARPNLKILSELALGLR